MNVSRPARLGRGLLAGVFAVFVAAVSHSVAGGAIAGPVPLVLGLVVAMLVCVPLAARRLSWSALVAGVSISQVAFHLLFEFFGPASVGASGSFAVTGHQHGAAAAAGAAGDTAVFEGAVFDPAAVDAAALAVASHPLHGAEMWLAHMVAGVLTIAMLRGGEAAAWRLIELAVGWALARMPRAVVATAWPELRAAAASAVPTRRHRALLRCSLRYRGPPALAA